jgi:transcriptional regulator with XRE-family HTH domain
VSGVKFGAKLKMLREKHGLSQKDLAGSLDLGPSTIGQYEIGSREPNFRRLRKIKSFFKVDYNFLLENKKDDQEVIKKIELDIVDLKEVLKKNYIIVNGKKMSEEAKKGLIVFLENY